MKRCALLLIVVCLGVGCCCNDECEVAEKASVAPITIGERLTIASEVLGEERTILVSTPAGYDQSSESYPVLYLTDGDGHLTHTRGTVDFLVRNGLMPDVIIVGVTNTDRTRDLTPTNASFPEDDGEGREFPTSGGASAFLDFFEQELFPYVEENYRTQPLRLFSGHSFGGLFALNAIFTRPTMFGAVLSVSPSLRWDEDLPLRQAAGFFEGREEDKLTLVVAMANEEEGDPAPTRLDRLEATLQEQAPAGFEWAVLRMPDETHGSVVLRAHYWGLRKVFDGWRLPTDPGGGGFAGSVAEMEAHYERLSARWGFEVAPPEAVVNLLGYRFLGREEYEQAIAYFRRNVELYPGSANVYDSLGEALENQGGLEEALRNYTKAVETAVEIGDGRLEIFTGNRDRVRRALQTSDE